jgi:hypothetical protein
MGHLRNLETDLNKSHIISTNIDEDHGLITDRKIYAVKNLCGVSTNKLYDLIYISLPKPKTNFLKRSFRSVHTWLMLWNNFPSVVRNGTSLYQWHCRSAVY